MDKFHGEISAKAWTLHTTDFWFHNLTETEIENPNHKGATCVDSWCTDWSWVSCSVCGKLETAKMRPQHFQETCSLPLLKHVCRLCKHKIGRGCTVYEDIPVELRNLSQEFLGVLQPLQVDVEQEARHECGYRAHQRMCTFLMAQ